MGDSGPPEFFVYGVYGAHEGLRGLVLMCVYPAQKVGLELACGHEVSQPYTSAVVGYARPVQAFKFGS